MNHLLKDYLKDLSNENLTYVPETDVNILIDNLNNEFPNLTKKEKEIINEVTSKLVVAENGFSVCETDTDMASYNLIWENHIKELIEKL